MYSKTGSTILSSPQAFLAVCDDAIQLLDSFTYGTFVHFASFFELSTAASIKASPVRPSSTFA